MLDLSNVYWLPIFCASLVGIAFSVIWYSPCLLGAFWMEKKENCGGAFSYIFEWALTFLEAYVLALLIINFKETTTWGGFVVGFWVWFGFIAPTTCKSFLWGKMPFHVFILHILGSWGVFELMGILLGAWQF